MNNNNKQYNPEIERKSIEHRPAQKPTAAPAPVQAPKPAQQPPPQPAKKQ